MDRKLRMDVARARAAVERYELARAIRDVRNGAAPIFKAAQSVKTATRAFGEGNRAFEWLASVGLALAGRRLVRRALALVAWRLLGGTSTWRRVLASGLTVAVALAARRRRARRAGSPPSAEPAKMGQ